MPKGYRLVLLALTAVIAAPLTATARSQLPRPAQLPPAGGTAQPAPPPAQKGARPPQAQGQNQPPAAPAKAYKPVAVALPPPANDPSFEAFRKQLGEAASRKDRAALAKLVVAQGFFWESESGDKADKKKSGIDNLVAVLELGGKDTGGWDTLVAAAGEPTFEPFGDRKGVMCSPANPQFDEQAFEVLVKETGTEAGEWAFPTGANIDAVSEPKANAAPVEKLGMNLVRILPEEPKGGGNPNEAPFLHVVLSSGKTAYISAAAVSSLSFDQLCYTKDASGWKINGYVGVD